MRAQSSTIHLVILAVDQIKSRTQTIQLCLQILWCLLVFNECEEPKVDSKRSVRGVRPDQVESLCVIDPPWS